MTQSGRRREYLQNKQKESGGGKALIIGGPVLPIRTLRKGGERARAFTSMGNALVKGKGGLFSEDGKRQRTGGGLKGSHREANRRSHHREALVEREGGTWLRSGEGSSSVLGRGSYQNRRT